MKYLIVVDDNFISNFRRDDDGLTLVVKDESDATRAVRLKPIIRPIFTGDNGESIYLPDEYIEAMLRYEHKKTVQEVLDSITLNAIDDITYNYTKVKPYVLKMPYRVDKPCFGCKYKLETPHGIQCSFTDCVWERENG